MPQAHHPSTKNPNTHGIVLVVFASGTLSSQCGILQGGWQAGGIGKVGTENKSWACVMYLAKGTVEWNEWCLRNNERAGSSLHGHMRVTIGSNRPTSAIVYKR